MLELAIGTPPAHEYSPAVARWRALAEIDENLVRRDLTAAQRAKETARRKKAYEAVHSETKHGGAPGKAGGGKAKGAKFAAFAEETARRSGKSQRSVELDATREKRLGSGLDLIAGTSLDVGAELDALGAMPPDEATF
jgi:hypothetical protein